MSKWTYERGVFYPCGDFKLYPTPGKGIFNLVKNPNPMDGRLGLERVADRFEFPYKIYNLGIENFIEKVKKTWTSPYFEKKNQNLGIIFNGLKGTGKTVGAKILCNELDIPVINISYYLPGMLEFLQSLEFECIILLDEAEKVFRNDDPDSSQVLLKMVDGVLNKSRKLYILTSNTLNLNENLLGRPGRIRYIQNFGNINAKAINEYVADNLEVPEAKSSVLSLVDSLEVSTIDTLKSIVDEANIHGFVNGGSQLNIQFSTNYFDCLYFEMQDNCDVDAEEKRFADAKAFIKRYARMDKPITWAYLTKFNKTMDPDWNWDDPVDIYEEEDEREIINNAKVIGKSLTKKKSSCDSDGGYLDVKACSMPIAADECCGIAEDPSPVEVNEGKEVEEEVHYLEEYLARKFHVYTDTVKIKGTRLEVGMDTENFGPITKKDNDGWFYSNYRNGRVRRFITNDARKKSGLYRGELDY